MTRGQCEVHLGVLHPIESYWLAYGTEEKTGRLRRELNDDFDALTAWLIGDTKDFDFIAESLIPQLYQGIQDGRLRMGEMSYSVLLAPNMLTMRRTTLKMLRELKAAGGAHRIHRVFAAIFGRHKERGGSGVRGRLRICPLYAKPAATGVGRRQPAGSL